MFTGITQELGRVIQILRTDDGKRFTIKAPQLVHQLTPGASIALNGCCLTVETIERDAFTATAVRETLERTNLAILATEELINLELPMQPHSFFGGHMVLGHIDTRGRITHKTELKAGFELTVELPESWSRYVVSKGSIAIDGVSLTPFNVQSSKFQIAIIPHTAAHTTLGFKKVGDSVNIEVDILAKYCERLFMRKDGIHE